MASKGVIIAFAGGLALGGLAGGVGGYVINDLTSVENEEVMAEIEEAQQTQEDLDNFFNDLSAQPAPTPPAARPADEEVPEEGTAEGSAAENEGSGAATPG